MSEEKINNCQKQCSIKELNNEKLSCKYGIIDPLYNLQRRKFHVN